MGMLSARPEGPTLEAKGPRTGRGPGKSPEKCAHCRYASAYPAYPVAPPMADDFCMS